MSFEVEVITGLGLIISQYWYKCCWAELTSNQSGGLQGSRDDRVG